MKHSRYFEYTVVFDSPQAKAGKWKFRNPVDRRLKFPLTAKPIEHLQMFVDNMNQRDSGWTIGRCIDAPEKTISYNHAYCIDALSQMADEWETEYEFVGKQVSLWKVEYNRDNPLPLSYGKGNGFKPGIGRSNYEDSTPIEILYIQGGEQNIDASQYGSSELLLPKSQTIRFDGEHFEGEQGFDSSKARTYQTDADGFSIRRADKPLSSQAEDSLDCSEIYPSRVGTISAVTVVDASKHFYDIVDNSIPASLNFEDCLIEGETLTIIPQTGMLAGKEFEAKYIHNAKEGKAARRFEIVPQDIDGQTMPGGNYIPQVGDTYAVFHCMLPAAYICDNATKTGASWDMFRQGVKYLYDNEEQKFTFTGELDGIWAKKDWLNIGGRIKLGGFVQFSDERFQPEGVLVRIIGIKDYINNPHSPEIELSNSTVGRTVSSDLRKIESNEVVMDTLHKEALQFTKRRYRDSMETIEMLSDALLDNFSNSINPIAVQTMAMLIGDKSLQFEFVDSMTNPSPVVHNVTYNQATKVLSVPAGIIQHYTLGIDTISSSHVADEYKFWSLPAFTTPTLTDGTKKYYLYAKVSKTAKTGTFYISEQAIAMEGVAGYYHLLMGVLNSEYDGERSYVSLYGFTEVLPGQVRTNKIISSDGKTYFDLLQGIIAGKINFIDGLISGSIGVGNGNDLKVFITGEGTSDESVVICAGAKYVSIKTAPFRVTQGGKMYSSDADVTGKITAKSGSIGGFEIAEGRIGVASAGNPDDDTSSGLSLNERYVKFSDKKVWAGIGANVAPAVLGVPIPGIIRNEASLDDKAYGLQLDVQGAVVDNIALDIPHGAIHGVRHNVRILSNAYWAYELTDADYEAIVNDADITVRLPAAPQKGQVFRIWKHALGNATIQSLGPTIRPLGSNSSGTTYSIPYDNHNIFEVVYTGSEYLLKQYS